MPVSSTSQSKINLHRQTSLYKRMFDIFPQFCLKTKSANRISDTDLPLSKSNPLRMIQWHTTRCSNTITIYTQAKLLHTNWCNWTSQIPQHTCDNWTLTTEQNMLIAKRINHLLTAMIMLWTSLPFRTPTHFVSQPLKFITCSKLKQPISCNTLKRQQELKIWVYEAYEPVNIQKTNSCGFTPDFKPNLDAK